jgi:hypothetical protein
MNTRRKVQLISGMILDYFIENKAPSWTEMYSEFINYNITKLTGLEFFKDHHYLLTVLLLKEEYSLSACFECGFLFRKTVIEESIPKSCNNWMTDY